jgi:hypothetical protein
MQVLLNPSCRLVLRFPVLEAKQDLVQIDTQTPFFQYIQQVMRSLLVGHSSKYTPGVGVLWQVRKQLAQEHSTQSAEATIRAVALLLPDALSRHRPIFHCNTT